MTGAAVSVERNTEGVRVTITKTEVIENPPAWEIGYEVTNLTQAPVWLVVDENVIFTQDDSHIELSYARGKMRPGVHVFGYFDPQVVQIEPGASVERSVEITWPAPLSAIWNETFEAAPAPGVYEVSIRLGYGRSDAPGPFEEGDDVEAPVLRWQEVVVSAPVSIEVPQYDIDS